MNAVSHTFDVDEAASVEIKLPAGSARIVEGEAGRITVSVSGRFPDRLKVEQFGNHIEIAEARDQRLVRGSYRVAIEAPAGIQLAVATGSGDLDARLPLRSVRLSAGSGDATLGTVTGAVEVKVASGAITVSTTQGRARIASASGDIEVGEAVGDTSISSASGDVRVGTASGDLDVKTASGDIEVDRYLGTHLRTKSVSGDVVVRLPSGRRVQLQLSTLSGEVSVPSERPSTGEAVTTVRVAARSVSGDITIARAEAPRS